MESIVYLDTNVVLWLFKGDPNLLSKKSIKLMNENDLLISPIVSLELTFLNEIKRLHASANEVIDSLKEQFDLNYCHHSFQKAIEKANAIKWTRDPFDRIITAQAGLENCRLLTKDQTILKHYSHAIWD